MPKLDEHIKKSVIDQLYWDDRIDASNITVTVDDGVVTLGGTAPSYFARDAAVRDARNIFGVADVVNDIEIRFSDARPPIEDQTMARRILELLESNPVIDAQQVMVTVDSGNVEIEGTVNALWKKFHVENLVANEPWIVSIKNRLVIVPSGSYVDQNIAASISEALQRNRLIDADNIDVHVENRAVTFSGEVDSWPAREEAYETALYTPGVESIHDDLSVAEPV